MDGTLSVRNIGGDWTVTNPYGSTITVDPATYGIPEAVAYAASSGNPLDVFALGTNTPFVFENYMLQIPAQVGASIRWHGAALEFYNTGTAVPGIQIDTFPYGLFGMAGCQIRYEGNGPAVQLRPVNQVPSAAGPTPATIWTRQSDFDFGTIIAIGGEPEALLALDTTAVAGATDYLTSAIVANVTKPIRFVGEGYAYARHGLLLRSPASSRQLIAQNAFDCYIETCREEEVMIGSMWGAYDEALATNFFEGNYSHELPTGNSVVFCNGPMNRFSLNSANIEAAGAPYNFVYGPKAYGNNVETLQAFGAAISMVKDYNADPTRPNTFTFGVPANPNFQGSAATPSGSTVLGNFTNVDRSWNVANGRTVNQLWFNTTTPGTYALKLLRRNAPTGLYDVVVAATIVHGGAGWESVGITPFAVPSDGNLYYVGIWATGAHPLIDNVPRAYASGDIAGSGVAMTENAATPGWLSYASGVSYQ